MKKRILKSGWIVWPLLATVVNTLIIPPTSLFAAGELSFAGPTGSPVPTVAVCTSGAGCNLQTNGFVEPTGPTTLQNTQTFLSQNGLQAATIVAIPNESKEKSNGIYYLTENANDASIWSLGDVNAQNSAQKVDLYSGDPVVVSAAPDNFQKDSGEFSVSPNGSYAVTLSNTSLYNSQYASYSTSISLYDSKNPPSVTTKNIDVPSSFKIDGAVANDKGGYAIVKRNVTGYGSPAFTIEYYPSATEGAVSVSSSGTVPLIAGGSTPILNVKSWNLALEGDSVRGYKMYLYGVSSDSSVVHVVVFNLSADSSSIDNKASSYFSVAYTGGTVEKIPGQDIFLMTGDPNAFIATSDKVSMTLVDPATGQKDTFAILAKKNSSGGSDPVIVISRAGNNPPAQIKALNSYLHNYINAYGISYTNPKFTVLGFTPTNKGSVAIKFEVVESNNPSKKATYILPVTVDALLTGLGFINLPKYYPSTIFTTAAVKYKNVKTEAKSNAVSIIVEEINGLPEGNSTVVARVKDSAGNIVQSIARDINIGKHQMDNIKGGYIEDPAFFVVEGLLPGQSYTYELIAYDAKGLRINNLGTVAGYSNVGTFYTNQFSNLKLSSGAINNDVKMTFTLEGLPIRNSPTNDVTVYFEIWHPNGYLVSSVSKVVRNTSTATQPGPITDSLTIPNITGGLGYNYVLRTASNFPAYYQKTQGYFWMPPAGQPGIDFSPNINSPRPVMMLSPMAVGGSLQFVMGNGRMLDYTDKKAVLVNVDNTLQATLLSFTGNEVFKSVNVSPNGRYVGILYLDASNQYHRYVYDTFRNIRQEDTILSVSGFTPSSFVIDDQNRIFIVGANSTSSTTQVVVYKNGQLLGQVQFNYASKNVLNQIAIRNDQELLLYGVYSSAPAILSTQVIGISDMGAQWRLTPLGTTQSRFVKGSAPEYLGVKDGVELIRMKYPQEEILAVGDYGQLSLASMTNTPQSSWAFNSIKTTYDPMGRVWSVTENDLSLYDPSTDRVINRIPSAQLLQNLGLNTDPAKVYYLKSIAIKEELVPRSASGEKVSIYALDLLVYDANYLTGVTYQVNGRLEELYSYGFGMAMTPLTGKVRFRDVNAKMDINVAPPKGKVDFLVSGIPVNSSAALEVLLYEDPLGVPVETVTPTLDVNGRWVANFTKLKFGTNFTYKIRTTAASPVANQESYIGELRVPLQKTVSFGAPNNIWLSNNSIFAEIPLSGIPTGSTATNIVFEMRDTAGNVVYRSSQNVTSATTKLQVVPSPLATATTYTYELRATYNGERIEKKPNMGNLSTDWDVYIPDMTYQLQGNNFVFNIPTVNGLLPTANRLTVEILNGPQTTVLTSGSVPLTTTSSNQNLVVTVPTTGLQPGVQYVTRVRIDRNTAPTLPNTYYVPYTTPNVVIPGATITVGAITSNSVDISGTVLPQPTGTILSVRALLANGSVVPGSTGSVTVTNGNWSGTISNGLSPNTTYTAQLIATSSTGVVTELVTKSFTTRPADTTPPTVSGVTAISVSGGIQVTWTTNEASSTQIEYGTTTAYGSSTTLDTALVTSHTQVLSGVTPGTLYHYRVKSRDAAGNLVTSQNFTYTPVSATIGNLQQYATSISFLVTGSGFAPSSSNYMHFYKVGPPDQLVGSNSFPANALGAVSQSFTLARDAASSYIIKIYDSRNMSAPVATRNIGPYTNDTTPPTVSGVNVTSVNNTSVTINWATNEGSTTQVLYGTTLPLTSSTMLDQALVTNHTQTINGLAPGTMYYYQVKSLDSMGNVGGSGTLAFTTTGTPTTTISAVNATSVTSGGATITWSTNVASDTQIEYGPTTAYGSSTTLNTTMLTSHSQTISGLNPNTTYNYRVKSRDAAGNLVVSGNYTFTTTQPVTLPLQIGHWYGTAATSTSRGYNFASISNIPVGTTQLVLKAYVGSFTSIPSTGTPVTVNIPVTGTSMSSVEATLQNLLPGTNYTIFMTAGTEAVRVENYTTRQIASISSLTPDVIQATSASFKISGTLANGTVYAWLYKKNSDGTYTGVTNVPISTTTLNNYSFSYNNLSPNSDYQIRIMDLGEIAKSLDFRTMATTPQMSITGSIGNVQSTSAVVTLNGSNVGTNQTLTLTLNKNGVFDRTVQVTLNAGTTTSNSVTLSNLTAGAQYTVSIPSVTFANNTFTTPAQMGLSGTIGNLTPVGATITLTGTSSGAQTVTLTLNKKVGNSYVFDRTITITVSAGNYAYGSTTIQNLVSGTQYQVVPPAGVTIAQNTFVTPQAYPRVQGQVTKTATSVTYTLTPQNIPAGMTLSATLYDFTERKYITYQWPGKDVPTSGVSTVSFTGLIPGRQYAFDVHDTNTYMSYYNNIFTA